MEIGFNGDILLSYFYELIQHQVTSFDIGHITVAKGKQFIDEKFPNRHRLTKGDSLVTVPEFSKS